MEVYPRAPESPGSDRSIDSTARGVIELGELYLSRSRLRAPRWRLHALLALIPAARALGASTRVMSREVRVCCEAILAGRQNAAGGAARSRARDELLSWLGDEDAPDSLRRACLLQGLARTLLLGKRSAPLHHARVLLAAGCTHAARQLTESLENPAVRRRALDLTGTGIWRRGAGKQGREFVGAPFDDDYPPSLPRLVAMTQASRPGEPLTGSEVACAESLLARLGTTDRQEALAHWAAVASRAGGLAAGAGVVRSIRYRSRRQLAWLLVLQASLEAGRLDDAWRICGQISAARFRDRARLTLARELIRRGRGRRAERLLTEASASPCRGERALLLCEMRGDAERVKRELARWRTAPPRPAEDLSWLDPSLPRLAHRWTLAALRAGLRRQPDALLGIPAPAVLALARDRRGVRRFLADLETDGLDLPVALRALRWITSGADMPIWSEHLSSRAERLAAGGTGPAPPRRLGEALVLGLRAEGRRRPELAAAVGSGVSCALDEGASLSRQAAARRRAIVRAAKYCLKVWLVDRVRPPRHALRARLRCLSNLGGSLAVEHLLRVMRSVRHLSEAYAEAFAALIALAPERAARLYFRDHAGLLLADLDLTRKLLQALEDHRVLESGFAELWCRLLRRVRKLLGEWRGAGWLRQLTTAWPGGWQTLPRLEALHCCLQDVERWPVRGGGLIARAQHRLEILLRTPTRRLPVALLEEPAAFERLAWLRPGSWEGDRRSWHRPDWKRDLAMLRDDLGEVDAALVWRLARHLASPHRARALARRWLRGCHPLPGATPIVALPRGASGLRRRLRYLDKRRDLFTFLRLADCVPCCFNSTTGWYRRYGMGRWVLALWKDPLSFCLHVERRGSEGWRPCGFVFGGYALMGSSPVVLLHWRVLED